MTGSFSVTGSNPGIDRLRFYIDGERLLTDYQAPWRFTLPTDRWADGDKLVEVEAVMRDDFASERAGLNLNFANGPEAPRQNDRQFTPSTGTPPEPGKPFVLAAVGDGRAARRTRTRARPDPVVGPQPLPLLRRRLRDRHRRRVSQLGPAVLRRPARHHQPDRRRPRVRGWRRGARLLRLLDNIPHYYSYDAAGWHFIALDSSVDLGGSRLARRSSSGCAATSESSEAACTIAYMHMPRFNIGKSGEIKRLNDVWRLLSDHGVELLMAGHDHTYQRWRPVDANGELASSDGMTQFIVGNGGHGYGPFVRSDERVAASSTGYGAQRMELNSQGAAYRFITPGGVTLDSGSVQCGGTPPDATPRRLRPGSVRRPSRAGRRSSSPGAAETTTSG